MFLFIVLDRFVIQGLLDTKNDTQQCSLLPRLQILRPINIIHLTDLTLVEKCILPNEIFSSFKRLTQQIFKHIFEHLSWKLTWWAFLYTLSVVIFNFSKSTWPMSTTPSAMNGYRAYSNKGLYVYISSRGDTCTYTRVKFLIRAKDTCILTLYM